jgi:hypothetical protein
LPDALLPDANLMGTRQQLSIWAALCALCLIPFLLTPLPPLNDYPSHLARAYIILELPHSHELQQFYEIEWKLVPNLALDLIVPALAGFMPVEAAMKVFTALTLVLLSSGVVALNRALFGRVSLASLTLFLILYNRQFLWGFLNYLFALALCVWVFAAWVQFRGLSASVRILLFSLASFGIFICHLHPFATYAVLVMGYELHHAIAQWRSSRRSAIGELAVAASQFILPFVALVFFSPTGNRAGQIEFGNIKAKITGLVDAFHSYARAFDLATILIVLALVAAGLLTRRLEFHRRMVIPLVSLAILYLIMPVTLFGSCCADRRLATSIYIVAAGCLYWHFSGTRIEKAAAVALLALILVRTGLVAYEWRKAGRLYAKYLQAFEQIPSGSRIGAAVAKRISPFLENPPVMFISCMAVVRRNAFVNSLFAEEGHQPLSLKYRPADVKNVRFSHVFFMDQHGGESQWHAADPFERIDTKEYDYILLVNPQYFEAPVPPGLRLISSSEDRFALYRKDVERREDAASSPPREASGQELPR